MYYVVSISPYVFRSFMCKLYDGRVIVNFICVCVYVYVCVCFAWLMRVCLFGTFTCVTAVGSENLLAGLGKCHPGKGRGEGFRVHLTARALQVIILPRLSVRRLKHQPTKAPRHQTFHDPYCERATRRGWRQGFLFPRRRVLALSERNRYSSRREIGIWGFDFASSSKRDERDRSIDAFDPSWKNSSAMRH